MRDDIHRLLRKRKTVTVCVEWYDMHPTRCPRFWNEVGLERMRKRVRKYDYQRMKVIVNRVAERRDPPIRKRKIDVPKEKR